MLQDADENASNIVLLPHIHRIASSGVREDKVSMFLSVP